MAILFVWEKKPLVKVQNMEQKMLGTKKNTLGWKPKIEVFVIILTCVIPQNKNAEGEFQEISHVFSSVPEGRSGSSIDSPSKFGESGRQEFGPTLGHPNVAGRIMYSLPIARVILHIITYVYLVAKMVVTN